MRLEFKYSLLGNNVSEEILDSKSLALVCYIEGHLTICFGAQVFLDEPTPLLELGAHLHRWFYLRDAVGDFAYTSMEHDEPILTFTNTSEDSWVVDSIWRKRDPFEVRWQELSFAVTKFLADLDVALNEKYGLRIVAFTDARLP